MSIKDFWWEKAKETSAVIGWFPTVILAQWQWETGNFTSSNFTKNNNIAGQTWQSYMPLSMKGTARPAAEGGYYIRYDDAAAGYIDFIQKNGRYANVKNKTTEEEQIYEIAARGWAADPNYAAGLIKTMNGNKKQGYTLEVDEPMLDKEILRVVLRDYIKPDWDRHFKAGNRDYCDFVASLGKGLREAAGVPAGWEPEDE